MNSKRILYWGLFFALLSFTSCEEEVLPENFTHRYQRTQCADPWGHEAHENKLFEDVKAYLKHRYIDVLEIDKFTTNNGQVCLACTCLGRDEFRIRVSESDGERLLGLNENWEAL